MNIIEINKDIIPYTFKILLSDEEFEIGIDYNNTADLFTASLSKNGKMLCAGEPIIYGRPLFGDLINRGDFPKCTIVPIDESGESNSVTYDNLSTTVLLQVTGGEYDE